MAAKKYNLKQLLQTLVDSYSAIDAISIFGSHAYGTGSLRSDCDMLIEFVPSMNMPASSLRNFSMEHCPALDFFLVSGGRATSCSNDSFVYAHSTDELKAKLDAKLLWEKSNGFGRGPFIDPANWIFEVNPFVTFVQSSLPNDHVAAATWHSVQERAEANNLPATPYIGDTIDKAAALLADVAKKMILSANDLEQRGNAKNGWTVNLQSEYDCQNLFYSVVRPWIGQIGREEVAIKFDKQEKKSDFNMFDDQLIVEMKFIDSEQKKREVVKTLDGLTRFYSRNSNVRCLLFLIYVKSASGVSVDVTRWEADYTSYTTTPKVVTWVIPVP